MLNALLTCGSVPLLPTWGTPATRGLKRVTTKSACIAATATLAGPAAGAPRAALISMRPVLATSSSSTTARAAHRRAVQRHAHVVVAAPLLQAHRVA
jgi:hypothetical protein